MDSMLVAEVAAKLKFLDPRVADDIVQKLKDLQSRLAQNVQMLELETERLRESPATVRTDIRRHIYFLQRSIAGLEEEFNRTCNSVWQ